MGHTNGDGAAMVHRLRAQLEDHKGLQGKLVAAYLKGDKAIIPVFERMNRKFEEEIAGLENQIAEVNLEKATFEQLLAFSKAILADIFTAWANSGYRPKNKKFKISCSQRI
jgi:hypothetical protein